jgi:nucleotide-binding universal stress UspA family protein
MSTDLSTIVVGYLPTAEGLAAFQHAKKWAESSSARLVVVNTGRNGDYSHPNFASAQDIDAIEQELSAADIPHEVLQPTDGQPAAEAILAVAESTSADLLVIGVRRRSPAGKLITGSTAQHILLDASCPVLAVKVDRGPAG